jgi:CBS domain-containing protein
VSSPATSEPEAEALTLEDLRGRPFISIEEAARIFRVTPRTARRWAAEYLESGGFRGLPVIEIGERRRFVIVARLLELAGDREEARPTPP